MFFLDPLFLLVFFAHLFAADFFPIPCDYTNLLYIKKTLLQRRKLPSRPQKSPLFLPYFLV